MWNEVQAGAGEFASKVERCFAAGTNKTIATLRKDGSPRISATELEFVDGTITLGMMGGSMKLLDVRRDPRVAIHAPTVEPPKNPAEHPGDAKLAGVLLEQSDHEEDPRFPGAGAFELDVHEAVLTYVDETETYLVIESWHPDRGCSTQRRR